MKNLKLLFSGILVWLMASGLASGQDKKAAEKAPAAKETKPLLYKVCNPPVDTDNTHQVSKEDAIKWAQSQPMEVLCDGKYTIELYQFQVQIINMDPLSTNDFGMGDGGMPILAINAIKNAKVGDTVFLKNVTFKDRSSREVLKAPNIVFTIK